MRALGLESAIELVRGQYQHDLDVERIERQLPRQDRDRRDRSIGEWLGRARAQRGRERIGAGGRGMHGGCSADQRRTRRDIAIAGRRCRRELEAREQQASPAVRFGEDLFATAKRRCA
ncbi:MAG TPA: hypothetical protein VHT91_49285 [Kofleriaceae bacterium]|nr:hypothetical protein [Kofleriaceae bacterium]